MMPLRRLKQEWWEHRRWLRTAVLAVWAALTVSILFLWAIEASAAQGPMLRVEALPGVDQLVDIQTQVRHTTVIVLPKTETILDFVVGDSEYWNLTGAANVAFLKPIATGVETNVALVCESGAIYSFLALESSDTDPHLVVRLEPPAEEGAPLISPEAHVPGFVARSEVTAYQALAQAAQESARIAQTEADDRAAAATAAAAASVESFREDYPTRLLFEYRLSNRMFDSPFNVSAMWHDGQFTYLRSSAQESPALYEQQDGDPSLVAYDLTEDGLYIVRRVLGDGWLQIGDRRATWRFEPED